MLDVDAQTFVPRLFLLPPPELLDVEDVVPLPSKNEISTFESKFIPCGKVKPESKIDRQNLSRQIQDYSLVQP